MKSEQIKRNAINDTNSLDIALAIRDKLDYVIGTDCTVNGEIVHTDHDCQIGEPRQCLNRGQAIMKIILDNGKQYQITIEQTC
jgi:hypothetical protein